MHVPSANTIKTSFLAVRVLLRVLQWLPLHIAHSLNHFAGNPKPVTFCLPPFSSLILYLLGSCYDDTKSPVDPPTQNPLSCLHAFLPAPLRMSVFTSQTPTEALSCTSKAEKCPLTALQIDNRDISTHFSTHPCCQDTAYGLRRVSLHHIKHTSYVKFE